MNQINNSTWGSDTTQFFYQITPEVVLRTVESFGIRCTGRVLTLNSLENRVYEVELDIDNVEHPWDRFRVIKFYRPGRWNKEQISQEHQFLSDAQAAEISVVAPINLANSGSVLEVEGLVGLETPIYAALFPKVGGRIPEELNDQQLMQIGRLIARLHIVGASADANQRMQLTVESYALANLEFVLGKSTASKLPSTLRKSYQETVEKLAELISPILSGVPIQRTHGDLHPGNLLWGSQGLFLVDFDDMLRAPVVQDIWLLAAGNDNEAITQRDLLIEGYEELRKFDRSTLKLVEPLRTLRLIHYCGWIARRYEDPAFKLAFPQFQTEAFWQQHLADLVDQLELVQKLF